MLTKTNGCKMLVCVYVLYLHVLVIVDINSCRSLVFPQSKFLIRFLLLSFHHLLNFIPIPINTLNSIWYHWRKRSTSEKRRIFHYFNFRSTFFRCRMASVHFEWMCSNPIEFYIRICCLNKTTIIVPKPALTIISTFIHKANRKTVKIEKTKKWTQQQLSKCE